jgi:hypothetical protein
MSPKFEDLDPINPEPTLEEKLALRRQLKPNLNPDPESDFTVDTQKPDSKPDSDSADEQPLIKMTEEELSQIKINDRADKKDQMN